MELCYRGLTYNYNPPTIEMGEEKVGGTYRGLEWRFRNIKKAPVMQTNLDLKYRGLRYHVGSEVKAPQAIPEVAPVTPVVAAAASMAGSVAETARALMISRDRSIKIRQQAMLGRLATEVGLTADSGKYWSRIQGKIQPTFRVNYEHHVGSYS
ncbi:MULTISPECIES: DUF4278 domain-containing protein [unclassified Roseofilum]|uniref:DUF4278 domain-containing protein n=1 Tax=unclassified Roseofilum TaxID=2620099 RepID=UPI000E8DDC73|nr:MULTISPECIES: DUF4278 domain-containing protein [unclassified Roseofilum]HBQ99857.1 hypothetical protein [Cyanobacteria bacterium UBA11691]MBP0009387.1 DUF4278 domain-containing protein [Roseofilum sp. Belize Diploria]MBP0011652.1 DUF4278 domain-containing protein [Roseofilum sp. SID3]MBP0025843.1 DUF4278 domain-containing protein [Roseofilum sp. SID2]MBP0033840.1 DUF4278 domain-containing protein [Roseofilum sp. Belize BBD 4]